MVVQDKVGPLEGSDGNIITEGFLMAENLNEYFSSVFTREDISISPVLETKFEVLLFKSTNCNPNNGSYENKRYE